MHGNLQLKVNSNNFAHKPYKEILHTSGSQTTIQLSSLSGKNISQFHPGNLFLKQTEKMNLLQHRILLPMHISGIRGYSVN